MNFQIPVQHMFTLVLEGMDDHRYDYQGPFGRRRFERAVSGTVSGSAMTGKVLELLATDYGRVSDDGAIRSFNFSLTLQSDDGTAVLMQFRGRASPHYGPGQHRIQLLFQAPDGPFCWFNGIQAVGIGSVEGGRTTYEVYALTSEPGAPGPDDTRAPADRKTLASEFVLRRRSEHIPGAPRHVIRAPLGTRYFTLAEGGGKFEGPRVSGDFISGFSWSPHRMKENEEGILLMQYDVETFLTADDSTPILMAYTGVSSPRYPKGFWMTAALFETEFGPHGWLNEIQAVGFGRWCGDGAEYHYYALK